MCDEELPPNYNKIDLDVTAGSPVQDITLELLNDQDDEDCDKTSNNRPNARAGRPSGRIRREFQRRKMDDFKDGEGKNGKHPYQSSN